ncbi:MAG: phosphopantothenoylcysteine decarboxylase, partial [Stenotrophomonas sp.]
GAQVVLVSGPVQIATPSGVQRIDVRSAAQMRAAVLAELPADIYIGAAAVADYTPQQVSPQKLKKTPGSHTLVLELIRTADILAEVAAQEDALKLVVGFAAETHDVEKYARGKLVDKHLDLIIANQVGVTGGGFESDQNAAIAYWAEGQRAFPGTAKTQLAEQLLDLITERLDA